MKKIASTLLALVMTASLAAGCGSTPAATDGSASASASTSAAASASSESKAPEAPKLEGSITFLTHRTDKADNVLTDIAKEFMAQNPGVEIAVEPNKDDNVLKTRIAAGELPDIMFVPQQLGMTRKDYPTYFVDIGDLGYTKDNTYFYENGTGPDGKLYTLAIGMNYSGVVYSKPAFKAAGIEKAPQTREEWEAACQKLKDKGIVPIASNFKDKWPLSAYADGSYQDNMTGLDNYKNTLVDKDQYLIDEPGSVLDGLKLLRDFNGKGFFEKDLMSTNWDGCKKDIAQGATAMAALGTWFPPQVVENGANADDIGMFPWPGSKALVNGGDIMYGVTTNSKYPDTAKAFFAFMWQDGYMPIKVGMIPVNKDYQPDSAFLKELLSFNLPIVEGVADTAEYQTLKNKAQIDNTVMAQEYVTAANPQEVVDKYNKMWTDAKAALGK